MRWLFFFALAGFSLAARLLGREFVDDVAGSALMALGCLILGGVLCGELAVRSRLPRITGYLLLGIVAGPFALGLETFRDAENLRLFEDLALGLIALTAGGELRWQVLRGRAGGVLAITGAHTVGVLALVAGGVWAVQQVAPILGPLSAAETLGAVALLGVIAVAVSPATTIAVITDSRARGPLVDTVLGVTILKDLVILLLFTWVSVMVASRVSGQAVDVSLIHHVGLDTVFSLIVGAVLGVFLGIYVTLVGRHLELTVLFLALISLELSRASSLEHLLVCMAAGFVARNAFPKSAGGFLAALEEASPPVYTVFFALVGASLDLKVLASLWIPALVFVSIRGFAVWILTRVPARLASAPPAVIRWAWMGFIAQAGLSLGLASRIARDMPSFGVRVATLAVAAVVVNQLLGPVLWAYALRRSGEAGAARPEGESARAEGSPPAAP